MTEPLVASPSRTLVEAFDRISAHMHSSESLEDAYNRLCRIAVDTIAGCDSASISTVEPSGPVTHGPTDAWTIQGDNIQYEEGEGPCLDAAMQERWVYTRDMDMSDRWPATSVRLFGIGVRSMFACRLALDATPENTLGGLNLYSRTRDAFAEEDQLLAILLSSLGAVMVDGCRRQANLRAAVESRQVIGEAIGILRAQGDVTSDEAFEMLSRASQRMNMKLREVARQIAAGSVSSDQQP
jgi:hypothetical protein